jgi:hypothetical protein
LGAFTAGALLARPFRKTRLIRFLTSLHFSLALSAALAFLALVLGLIPQRAAAPPAGEALGLTARLGLDQLTSGWPMLIVYGLLLLTLGQVTVLAFRRRGAVFILNHLGLWLLLAAAGLGSLDRQREVMIVPQGGLEWRAGGAGGEIREMDLAVRLDRFDIDEYPAKVALADHQAGRTAQAEAFAFFQLDPLERKGRLQNYDLEVLKFLPRAVPLGPDNFVRAISRETVQAAELKVINLLSGKIFQGWVSSGGLFLPPRPLKLENQILALTSPEPRRFVSQVKVFTRSGLELEGQIEVNKPLKAGPWLIYQYSYDTRYGRQSPWSGFELVYDPWLPLALAGLALWSLGALGLIIRGRKIS